MNKPLLKNNKDHWGFYTVGDYKTYSKLEAVEASASKKIPFKWDFNNAVFDRYDWTIDPPGSLEFWYEQRARQLRDTYDYIVLLYSGGADSTNVLKAFMDNNIFVDEIATFFIYDGTSATKRDEANEEAFYTAIPTVEKLLQSNPLFANTKHRLIDGGKYESTFLKNTNQFDYWYAESNYMYCPYGRVMGNLREICPEYKDLAAKQSVCILWAYDKPRLTIQNNKYHLEFTEGGMSSLVPPIKQMMNLSQEYDEMFYWSPDMPQLLAKQGHTLMNYVKNVMPTDIDNFHLKPWDYKNPKVLRLLPTSGFSFKWVKDEVGYELTEHGLHKLIYKNWNPYTLVTPKPTSAYFGPKDDWLWSSNVEGSVPRWYKTGTAWMRNHIKKIAPDAWFEMPYDPKLERRWSGGTQFCRNSYCLEK